MGASSTMAFGEPAKTERRKQKQNGKPAQNQGSAFDMPRDYLVGRIPRLATHAREWWLNIDYVESEKDPDDEIIRLLIRRHRSRSMKRS